MPSVTVFAPQFGKDGCEVRNSTLYPNALCNIGPALSRTPSIGFLAALAVVVRPFLDHKAALANTSPRMARLFSLMLAALAPRASSQRRLTASIGSVRARPGSRSAIQRALRCSGSAARIGIGDPGCAGAITTAPASGQRECTFCPLFEPCAGHATVAGE